MNDTAALPENPMTGEDASGMLSGVVTETGFPPGQPVEERLRFETLLTELSATFIKLPDNQIDSQIEWALKRIVEFLQADRGGLAELLTHQRQLVITHSYHLPGVPPQPRTILNEQLPWYTNTIRQGEVLRLSRLPDDLPPEAAKEREYCIDVGLKSHVMIPLKVADAVVGAIGFASFRKYREWPEDLVHRLRLVGEIFANALARKQAEERAHHLRDQLAHVARITTLGELAAAIAHEINQPLCAIAMNAQTAQRLLAGDVGDIDEARETMQDIVADGRRATEIIARIRALLQKRPPELLPLDVNDAILEVIALLDSQLARKGISVSLSLQSDLPTLLGDRVQLQEVVQNLVLNAADAVSRAENQPAEICLYSTCDGGSSVVVSVRDTGPGVAPEHADQVFDAFFTTKPGGMGIGLAISRSIIEAHGGRIWFDRDGKPGATFRFALPIEEKAFS